MPAAPVDSTLKIGLAGYGEVGKTLCRALREKGLSWVGAWDILFRDPARGRAMREQASKDRIEACESLAALLGRADIVISAVTAANALDVAREAVPSIRAGTFYLDLNSASPMTKANAAKLVEGAGAYYVEAGVMTPVPPYGIRAPMLLGGKRAGELAGKLAPLGFDMTPVSEDIGVASAIKLCRSVFIKGLEAIVVESFTLARCHGVERQLLASLTVFAASRISSALRSPCLAARLKSKAATFSAGRPSTASAEPRKCARRRTP